MTVQRPSASTETAACGPRLPWPGVALLTLAVLAAYANSLRGPFVFDDLPSIPDNSTLDHWAAALTPPPGGLTVSGRPLLNLSFALNHALSGPAVWSYHALNLGIHLLAGLVLFGIGRRTLRSPMLADRYRADADGLALGIALLWAVHPLQTESVTYVVQRAESLAGLWYLLVLYCFVRGAASPNPTRWFGASMAACFLGVATKETVATAPLIVLFYDRAFVSGTWRAAWQRHARLYGGLALSWLLLGWLVAQTGSRGGTAGFGTPVVWWAYGLKQLHAVTVYLRLAVWPRPLTFDYGASLAATPGQLALGASVVGALLAFTLVAVRQRPALGFAGVWFFVILAPSSSVVPVATQAMAEHRMYLPLAAVIGLVVLAAHHWLGRRALWGALLLALACAVLTAGRNRDYRSALTLWSQALAYADNPRAHLNLGIALGDAGRPAEAIIHYEAALKIDPRNAEAHYNRGNTLFDLGRVEEAAVAYAAALQLKPNLPKALYNLGNILAKQRRLPEAANYFLAALQFQPDYAAAHYNLANTLIELNRLPEAIPHYRETVRLVPTHLGAHFNLGNALMQADRPAEAIPEYESVLRLDPSERNAARNLAAAKEAAGQR